MKKSCDNSLAQILRKTLGGIPGPAASLPQPRAAISISANNNNNNNNTSVSIIIISSSSSSIEHINSIDISCAPRRCRERGAPAGRKRRPVRCGKAELRLSPFVKVL